MTLRDPWLVALDIDGTIMHEDGRIDPLVTETINHVRALGHRVTLATGRNWPETRPVLDSLGLEPEFIVCSNGAVTMRRDATAEHHYARWNVAVFEPREVLTRIAPMLVTGQYMVELEDGQILYTGTLGAHLPGVAREVRFEELLEAPATRVVVYSPDHTDDDFAEIIGGLGLHQVSYAIGWTAWLDIAPEGINKAIALERVRDLLGFASDRVLAVGDGRNDLEMLEWAGRAGRSAAMGQAPDEVRQAATEVVPSVHENGLVVALNALPQRDTTP